MLEIIITSSVLILMLVIVRKLCWGKINRRMQYGLWILVAIRLLVPAQFLSSPVSIMRLVESEQERAPFAYFEEEVSGQELPKVQKEKESPAITLPENVSEQKEDRFYESATEKNGINDLRQEENAWGSTIVKQSRKILIGIYIGGVLAIACVLLACNIRFRRMLCRERRQIGEEGRLRVYMVEKLESPCLCGIWRPAIYLNAEGLSSEEYIKYILAHEATHYRHGDHIWTLIRSLCLILYWFHPLVWLAAILSAKDGELACDEGTLKRLGEENRQAYGRTLIEMTASKKKSGSLFTCATGMINHKEEIRQRITVIAENRKPILGIVIIVIAVTLILAACTGGTAKEEASVGDNKDAFLVNEDGSYRLSEYQVELTGDKKPERIVFDVYYWADLDAKAEVITEELLWQELWNDCEVMARVLSGEDGKELWEYSYSDAHAGNGNLAVINYEDTRCLMQYCNWCGQGRGDFYYKILKLENDGGKPVVLEEKTASYLVPPGQNDGKTIANVLETAEELDKYLSAYNTEILLNASISGTENCYLHGSGKGLLNGVRRQTAFDYFMQEAGGNGWELNLRDYFYPDGMESMTVLPKNAEERIRAGEILCMEVSPDNATAGRLDLDGDGVREVLYLYGVSDWYGGSGWHFYSDDHGIIDENYRIRVNGKYYEDYCNIMDPVLMAYSPDGEQILLAVYDDGPSNDPKTYFFRYDSSGIHPAGMITDDLREVTIDENRVIKGIFRADMIQTEWAHGYYIWNGNEIVMREDEVYYLLDDSGWRDEYEIPLLLLEEITVYAERSEESRAMVMRPQKVNNVATDRKEWVLLEALDGTRGWLKVDRWKVPQLNNKSTSEVFEGLNMVD